MVGDKKLQRDGGGKVGRVSRVSRVSTSSISKVSIVESKAIGEEKKQSRIDKVKCAKQSERVEGSSSGQIRVCRVSR